MDHGPWSERLTPVTGPGYSPAMPSKHDSALAAAFAAKREEARATLLAHMHERGLRETDGWRINESIRHREGRTELVMRPIHMRLDAPRDLECWVAIEEPGLDITVDCAT